MPPSTSECGMNGPSASHSRLARAAHTFMVGPDQVIDGACRFAGRERSVSHQGRILLERFVPRLDEVPLAVLATPNDLADAAEEALLGKGVLIPALPEPIAVRRVRQSGVAATDSVSSLKSRQSRSFLSRSIRKSRPPHPTPPTP